MQLFLQNLDVLCLTMAAMDFSFKSIAVFRSSTYPDYQAYMTPAGWCLLALTSHVVLG